MFGGGGRLIADLVGWSLPDTAPTRYGVILAFNLVILMRMGFMMFYLMKRTLPWSEAFSVPSAFAIYYVGFAILVLPNGAPLGLVDFLAIGLFVLGCLLNTGSELQRHIFKKKTPPTKASFIQAVCLPMPCTSISLATSFG